VSLADLHHQVFLNYADAIRQAKGRAAGTLHGKLIPISVSILAGEVFTQATTGVPLVGSIGGSVFGLTVEQLQSRARRPRWLAADAALLRSASRKTGPS
jgi:hypothetical protein